MLSDEELMLAYKGGDRSAFDELVRRHWAGVAGLLRRLLPDEALVDDALVECFFLLHRAAATYEPRARFTTFLFGIAYHEAINVLRANRRWREGVVLPFGPSSSMEARLPCVRPDAEAQMLSREHLEVLDRLIDTLAETPRAVFLLYYQQELSTVDIAEALDIPVGSVRGYLCLARKALRDALAESEGSHAGAMVTRRVKR